MIHRNGAVALIYIFITATSLIKRKKTARAGLQETDPAFKDLTQSIQTKLGPQHTTVMATWQSAYDRAIKLRGKHLEIFDVKDSQRKPAL